MGKIKLEDVSFTDDELKAKTRRSTTMSTIKNVAKNIEYQQYFEVGQVLVKRRLHNMALETNNAGANQKYIVANKLPGGLIICRKLLINGGMGKGAEMIAKERFDSYRFEEDPDIADAILLDFDYDPLEMPKLLGKARTIMQRHNNKITLSSWFNDRSYGGYRDRDKDRAAALDDNIGMTLWAMSDKNHKTTYTIVGSKFAQVPGYGNHMKDDYKAILNNGTKDIEMDMYDLTGSWRSKKDFFISEPISRDEALTKVKMKAK